MAKSIDSLRSQDADDRSWHDPASGLIPRSVCSRGSSGC